MDDEEGQEENDHQGSERDILGHFRRACRFEVTRRTTQKKDGTDNLGICAHENGADIVHAFFHPRVLEYRNR